MKDMSQSHQSSRQDSRSSPANQSTSSHHSNDALQQFTSWSDVNKPGYSPQRSDVRSIRVEKRKYKDNDSVSDHSANEEQQQ